MKKSTTKKKKGAKVLKNFSVWVGGSEVNDHLLTFENAQALAKIWKENGYVDVQIELVNKEEQ